MGRSIHTWDAQISGKEKISMTLFSFGKQLSRNTLLLQRSCTAPLFLLFKKESYFSDETSEARREGIFHRKLLREELIPFLITVIPQATNLHFRNTYSNFNRLETG